MPPVKHIKEAGYTMNQTVDIYKRMNGIEEDTKVCYCGRLDPMARGLVYLLVGADCKMMPYYNSHNKEYTFEILFGMATDTDDPLGIISNMDFSCYNEKIVEDIKDYIIPSTFMQDFHDYSSRMYKRKPLWWYAKNNIQIKKPSHEVTINRVTYHDIKTYDSYEWFTNIIKTINTIDKSNNFRQESTIEQYNMIDYKGPLYSLPITINVTSGFYVRQLVCDIKKHLNIPIIAYDINRIKIFK